MITPQNDGKPGNFYRPHLEPLEDRVTPAGAGFSDFDIGANQTNVGQDISAVFQPAFVPGPDGTMIANPATLSPPPVDANSTFLPAFVEGPDGTMIANPATLSPPPVDANSTFLPAFVPGPDGTMIANPATLNTQQIASASNQNIDAESLPAANVHNADIAWPTAPTPEYVTAPSDGQDAAGNQTVSYQQPQLPLPSNTTGEEDTVSPVDAVWSQYGEDTGTDSLFDDPIDNDTRNGAFQSGL